MIKVFDNEGQFERYTLDGMRSGDLYYVKQNESVHFRTNNIDGIDTSYNIGGESGITPTGNITITENGDNIDVAEYATATVNVPTFTPTGNITISGNGENIDVAQYSTATVNVQPPQPTYTEATINQFSYTVNVPCVAGDTFEVYNPSHSYIMVYYSNSSGENVSAGINGNYENIYLTAGNQCPWASNITPAYFNISPDMSVADDITIYYRKL